MQLHTIQQKILINILTSENGLRYRDLKPENVENDLFNYHLQKLVENGLLCKEKYLYSLTEYGKYFIEEISPINPLGNVADRFKVAVLVCLLDTSTKPTKILYQIRKRQPLYGEKQIIGGPVKKGELLIEAAERKLMEETKLTANLVQVGTIRKIRYVEKGNLFSDIFYHIFLSQDFKGNLEVKNEFGENYWIGIDEAKQIEKTSSQGSKTLLKLYDRLQKDINFPLEYFFAEEISSLRNV
jgi:predicted transcriptional regulator